VAPPSVLKVKAGQAIAIADTTRSNSTVGESHVTRYFLSRDGILSGDDLILGERDATIACPGSLESRGEANVTVPSVAPGNYSIIACADATGSVFETREDDNCLVSSDVLEVQGEEPAETPCFQDDFTRLRPRRFEPWTSHAGDWFFGGDMLTNASNWPAQTTESWIWAGAPPVVLGVNATYSLTYRFVRGDAPEIGRHGGVMFCAAAATERTDPGNRGYTLDWIDRENDHGFRLIRWDGGAATPLNAGTPGLADPPADWRIELDAQRIRVFGDGRLLVEAVDGTYRGGRFGVWAWVDGQEVQIDNVSVGSACPDAVSGRQVPGDCNQDGSLNISDASCLLGHLFLGSPARLPCGSGAVSDASNVTLLNHNGDGAVNLSDAVALLSYLFLGGAPPALGVQCVSIRDCPNRCGG
jgi:hypothetical protein